jgi:hypothetical protein
MIEENTLIELYAQLSIINEMQISKSTKHVLTQNLFGKYNTTEEQFRQTVSEYHKSPERWISVIEKVKNKIQELKELYQPKTGQQKQTATDNRAAPDQPQGFIRPQRQDSRNSQTRPDSTAERGRR